MTLPAVFQPPPVASVDGPLPEHQKDGQQFVIRVDPDERVEGMTMLVVAISMLRVLGMFRKYALDTE
jgi:hypothetical protein